eukprot:gnl/MRDRNA2_/MRDRNA2_51788_c0_seq1.p1 gnl/MRDRNA2_/MRDRNA2_51788_c0~~gnl/MRDRNA2_/MRDRNA2_51788_c0_seq1.p1  ORF type:complete len:127 (+),score=9.59 gnl/MRDRNA2_/MRDRNA2_51788_c0_seq1:415-795(+)
MTSHSNAKQLSASGGSTLHKNFLFSGPSPDNSVRVVAAAVTSRYKHLPNYHFISECICDDPAWALRSVCHYPYVADQSLALLIHPEALEALMERTSMAARIGESWQYSCFIAIAFRYSDTSMIYPF